MCAKLTLVSYHISATWWGEPGETEAWLDD